MLVGTYVIVFILVLIEISDQTVTKNRQKRYLLFTKDTQWGVYATVSLPLELYSYVSVAWFFEASYYAVDNSTWFEPLLGDIYFGGKIKDKITENYRERHKYHSTLMMICLAIKTSRNREHRSIEETKDVVTRKILYIFIENMLERHGFPGRPCLLRAICENVDSHFLHNGLVGDLLYLILTPSTSISEDDIEDYYYEAEYNGLENNCDHYSKKCPENPLENISLSTEKV